MLVLAVRWRILRSTALESDLFLGPFALQYNFKLGRYQGKTIVCISRFSSNVQLAPQEIRFVDRP